MDSLAQRLWYGRSPFAIALLPLSWLFASLAAVRRMLYRAGMLESVRISKPVVVVGNITVGGTGKTPLVIWLARALRNRGHVPGIVTRGYGGTARTWPCDVSGDSDAAIVGDEAVLLAIATGELVVADFDRARAAQRAVERGASVVIADDGLQHYRLARDAEIAVIDASRGFGNGHRLPAGPLRESVRRLAATDAVVFNMRGSSSESVARLGHPLEMKMRTRVTFARSLTTGEQRPLRAFAGAKVHAVAGIGHPEAFFDSLRAHGLSLETRALPDHARIAAADLSFGDDAPIFMTDKDAVKCRGLADARCWAVPLEIELDDADALVDAILRKLDSRR
jgi:tetraacyldisaccharide 4'-kinase